MNYVIQKKEKCGHGIENMDFDYSPARCILCGKHSDETGYVYTEVDLLEVLKKLRIPGYEGANISLLSEKIFFKD